MKSIIIIFFGLMLIFSCKNKQRKDYKKFTITDFSKKKIDTLKPYENKSYNTFYIKVKGHVSDSVKIKRKGYYDIILFGKIDTLINGDYYGTEEIIWIFDPYNATKGKLEIEYSL